MNKWIKLFLLFLLLAFIIFGALMQTPFAQDKVRLWIEKKMDGALTIGKLEGFLPFSVQLDDVHYQDENNTISIDHLHAYLSPFSIFLGHFSLFRVHIDTATVLTKPTAKKTWPTFPLPIHIHSLRVDTLNLNETKGISLSGMGELSDHFSFQVSLAYNNYLIRTGIEGDVEKRTISIMNHIKKQSDINLWFSGMYNWDQEKLDAKIHGKAFDWNIESIVNLENSFLIFSDAKVEKGSFLTEGQYTLDLKSQYFQSAGNILKHPYSAKGKIEWDQSKLKLSDFVLDFSNNTLSGNLTYSIPTKSIESEIDLLLNDLSFYPLESPIEGEIEAHFSIQSDRATFNFRGKEIKWKELAFSQMTLNGSWESKTLHFQLGLEQFIVLDPAYEVFPPLHLQVEGTASKKQIECKGMVWGLSSTPFILSAAIPLNLSFNPFDLEIDQNAPLSVSVKGEGAIDPILSFLENASLIARGEVKVDLTLNGTWKNPQITGTLTYRNGLIESLTTGTIFRDIHMEIEAEGPKFIIHSLTARDHEQGTLSGEGYILWDPKQGFPFELITTTYNFHLLSIDPLNAQLDAQLTLSGNIHEMFIKGNASVTAAHLAIPNNMPTQIPKLDVTYINPLPTPKPEIDQIKMTLPINWDVRVEIPKKFIIEGRGLSSEWRGALRIFGQQDALNYQGTLRLIQGRFKIVGRTFDLTEGKIQIEGLETKDIYVNIKGDLELSNITASILVSGSLNATNLSFSSNPPMSTNQILSWILFNQDVNELTAFQACRLANVLVSLSGKYAGPKVFDNIKSGLGIDVFDITNCDLDSADLTFQVGKYISQGTFVGVSKSISGDFDSVLIQTRLYRNFYLEGNYGGSLNGLTPNGGKIIFKWYKTY